MHAIHSNIRKLNLDCFHILINFGNYGLKKFHLLSINIFLICFESVVIATESVIITVFNVMLQRKYFVSY